MTDPRRQTIAALQAKPADVPLLIANRVLCDPPSDMVLRILARTLGIIPSDYDTSADAGEPAPMAFGKQLTPISEADLIRKMMDPNSAVRQAQDAAYAASKNI